LRQHTTRAEQQLAPDQKLPLQLITRVPHPQGHNKRRLARVPVAADTSPASAIGMEARDAMDMERGERAPLQLPEVTTARKATFAVSHRALHRMIRPGIDALLVQAIAAFQSSHR
jgi:hypothetical protein